MFFSNLYIFPNHRSFFSSSCIRVLLNLPCCSLSIPLIGIGSYKLCRPRPCLQFPSLKLFSHTVYITDSSLFTQPPFFSSFSIQVFMMDWIPRIHSIDIGQKCLNQGVPIPRFHSKSSYPVKTSILFGEFSISCLIISLFSAISSFLPISPSSLMSGFENSVHSIALIHFPHLIHSSNIYFMFSIIEFFLLKIFFVLSICPIGQNP